MVALTDDGARCWGTTSDPETMTRMEIDDVIGLGVTISEDGTTTLE